MKLKFCLIYFFLINIFIFCGSAHCGSGISVGFNAGSKDKYAGAVSFKGDWTPWSLGVEYSVNDIYNADNGRIRITFDNWVIHKSLLRSKLDYFLFWGISAGVKSGDFMEFTTGSRLGAGFSSFLIENKFEFFCSACWNPYFGIDTEYSLIMAYVNFPVSGGLRVWF